MKDKQINPGDMVVVIASKVRSNAPWADDWGIERDCIAYISSVNNEKHEAECYFTNYESGMLPFSCLQQFVKPE